MLTRLLRSWSAASLPLKILGFAGVGAVALVVLAASPLFFNTRVDEEFITVAPAAPTAISAEAAVAPTAIPAEPLAEAPAAPTAIPAVEQAAQALVVAEAPAAPTAVPEVPVALSSGSFTRVDALHAAEGNATIYRTPEGELVLRLEEFASTNGPDLYVALSGHPMPRSSAEAHDDGYLEIARLKANQGNQNYTLPADIDIDAFKSVVIYCRAFSVVFSTAELR
jgi:hypothetical protein